MLFTFIQLFRGGKCTDNARGYTNWPDRRSFVDPTKHRDRTDKMMSNIQPPNILGIHSVAQNHFLNNTNSEPTHKCYINRNNPDSIILFYPSDNTRGITLIMCYLWPVFLFVILSIIVCVRLVIKRLLNFCGFCVGPPQTAPTGGQARRQNRPPRQNLGLAMNNRARNFFDNAIQILEELETSDDEHAAQPEREAEADDIEYALGVYLSELEQANEDADTREVPNELREDTHS
ncbi:hypothetical protein BLNAU_6464 [Blattamonas nauphoetae]|uniref:Uncharacterized protein n=1 Tax=Blattamonas nauphoetae TaxID=2049346 RepID=A0ABQ9Y4N1_9EUKA|nr:hypothetical protein BLNAU_6464 [Blattamonas nauphoetae]